MSLSRTSRQWLSGLVLTLLPVVGVSIFKQTSWGPVFAAPQARQIGPMNAKVIIVEYSDFQCPMCAKIQPFVHGLRERYSGKIRFIYKYFPLTRIHPNAMPAALAAECAAQQDKFWPYQDRLFQLQKTWAPLSDGTPVFKAIAQDIGLDAHAFQACLAQKAHFHAIESDVAEARRLKIDSTPTFFVGNTRLVGSFFEAYGAKTVEDQLK